MTSIFNFSKIPNLLFGPYSAKKLPEIIAPYSYKFILVTGSASFYQSKYGKEIIDLLKIKGLNYTTVTVESEPTATFINEICKKFKLDEYNAVVAIGGGSVIDAGKAISAMIGKDDYINDYLEGSPNIKIHSGTKLPFIAVPTTAGTGSEATKNAVISEIGEHGYKRSLRHDNFIPDIAIIDPILQLNCPKNITAASGLDAFTQLFESYISTQASILTDTLSFKGLELIANSLEKAYNDGNNIEARSEMAMAAYLSGITLANAGLGVVHGFASSIGGFFQIPHGVICGTLMGAANRINIEKLFNESEDTITIEKYARVGKLFCQVSGKQNEYYVHKIADIIDELIKKLNIPTLSKYGISVNDIKQIIAKTGLKNNPVHLSKEDLTEILTKRI
jgi:alcohol dehydrogenase class IV